MNTETHGLIGMLCFAAGLGVGLGGYCSTRLRTAQGWDARRRLHLLVLFLPVLFPSLLADDFVPGCPWWWTPSLFALAVLAGALSHWLRQRNLARWLSAFTCPDGGSKEAEGLLEPLARRLGIAPPPVRRVACDRPLALAIGSLQPVLYLSGHYLDGLCPEELRAVLAHELAHIARRDNQVAVWAAGLAWMGSLLPQVRRARRALNVERELAADELAVTLTRRPLVLAGVLLQAARSAPEQSPPSASALDDPADLPRRIERLLDLHRAGPSALSPSTGERGHQLWQVACPWVAVIALAVVCIDVLPFWLHLP